VGGDDAAPPQARSLSVSGHGHRPRGRFREDSPHTCCPPPGGQRSGRSSDRLGPARVFHRRRCRAGRKGRHRPRRLGCSPTRIRSWALRSPPASPPPQLRSCRWLSIQAAAAAGMAVCCSPIPLDDLAAAGVSVMEVKTLDRSASYPPYKSTCAFWGRTIGPLPGWQQGNPAAIYVAALRPSGNGQ